MTTSRQTSVSKLVIVFVLGAVLGLAGSILGPFHQPVAARDAGAVDPMSAGHAVAKTDWGDWVRSVSWEQPDTGAVAAVAPLLAQEPALVDAVLARYRAEPAGPAKWNVLHFLSHTPVERVIAQAVDWAVDSADVTARRDGLALLSALPPGPKSEQVARQALDRETDPQALSYALMAFRPQAPFDPAQVRIRVRQFHQWTHHPLAAVRAGAIQRLAEWDLAEQYLLADVMRLMDDADTQVRVAALGATSLAALKGDALKSRLLSILGNPDEEHEVRSAAEMQLYRFALSPAEYQAYLAGIDQLSQMAGSPVQ